MQLFYTPDITLPVYTLPAEESAHAVRVLRLAAGGELHLTDGRGTMHTARVVKPDPRGCVVEVVRTAERFEPLPYSLTVAVAPTKNADRFEWFLEKATEVGTDRIIPVECARSERRVVKHERSLKVVTEAMKQSLKAFRPRLDEMTLFAEAVKMPFEGVRLIAHCGPARAEKKWIGDCLAAGVPVLVMIGPEGDFTPAEVDMAVAAGFREVTLGGSRLRTETAALAAVLAVQNFSMK